ARWALGTGVAALAVGLALAVGAPAWVGHQYDGFVNGAPSTNPDQRARFTDPSSNGRVQHWKVAFHAFEANPFHGTGAGTLEFQWAQHRDRRFTVVDAHSLYIEALGELGVVGFLFLLVALGGIGAALLRRARGPNRVLYAALFA